MTKLTFNLITIRVVAPTRSTTSSPGMRHVRALGATISQKTNERINHSPRVPALPSPELLAPLCRAPSQQGDPPGAMPASERLIPNRGEERGSHSSQHSTFHQQTPCQGSGNHSSSGHGAAWAAAPKAVPLWGELQQGGRSQALSPQEGAYRLGALPGLLRRVSGGFPASQLSSDPIISQYIFKNKSRVA